MPDALRGKVMWEVRVMKRHRKSAEAGKYATADGLPLWRNFFVEVPKGKGEESAPNLSGKRTETYILKEESRDLFLTYVGEPECSRFLFLYVKVFSER